MFGGLFLEDDQCSHNAKSHDVQVEERLVRETDTLAVKI